MAQPSKATSFTPHDETEYGLWLYNFRVIAVGKVHGIDLVPDFMTREAFVCEQSAQDYFDYLFKDAKFPVTLTMGLEYVHK